ncbi:flagellar motor stator protein MotA [Bacillus solimangrovi]|uniref:Flagellar motor protein MotA n=1 Tax=Bacillus solimangrovi TaxID=1305675 RepID=A0A1E5LHH6_9BACI|nr:flagellar motor stator protein MotA [Bacillus solimangrovi]OEH93533.1 flagellar motor protein MotA [Bacillus solimangrovi]
MDKSTIIGIIFGIIAIGLGMVLKGVSPIALVNPAALLIIFLGTAGAVTIAFPTSEIKRIPQLFKIIFTNQPVTEVKDIIPVFVEWATVARSEGLLALETKIEKIDDTFLKNGMKLVIDGQSGEFIRDVMTEEVDAMEERHAAGALIFTQAGTYAPTLGVLGAVVGLIAALGNMNDTEALGHAIAAAFVATLFGIFSGYVLWHPFANKLKRKSYIEVKSKMVMIEGILSIQDGQAPLMIKEKLAMYVPINERAIILGKDEVSGEEKEEG